MSAGFIPFNHRPTNTGHILSGGYTPAVGKYARVIPKNHSANNFTINGNIIRDRNVVIDTFSTANAFYLLPGPSNALWTFRIHGGTSISITSLFVQENNTLIPAWKRVLIAVADPLESATTFYENEARGGDYIAVTGNNVGLFGIEAFVKELSTPNDYWLNTGDSASGDFYYEEYSLA